MLHEAEGGRAMVCMNLSSKEREQNHRDIEWWQSGSSLAWSPLKGFLTHMTLTWHLDFSWGYQPTHMHMAFLSGLGSQSKLPERESLTETPEACLIQPKASSSITSVSFCLLGANHKVQSIVKGRRVRLHLLIGIGWKNLNICVKPPQRPRDIQEKCKPLRISEILIVRVMLVSHHVWK